MLARKTCLVAAVALAFCAHPALGQENFGQSWKDMSPDIRDQMRQQYFSNLPESQQQRLRQNQQRFQALPGNQKRSLCQKFQSQNGYLPPACQNLLGP